MKSNLNVIFDSVKFSVLIGQGYNEDFLGLEDYRNFFIDRDGVVVTDNHKAINGRNLAINTNEPIYGFGAIAAEDSNFRITFVYGADTTWAVVVPTRPDQEMYSIGFPGRSRDLKQAVNGLVNYLFTQGTPIGYWNTLRGERPNTFGDLFETVGITKGHEFNFTRIAQYARTSLRIVYSGCHENEILVVNTGETIPFYFTALYPIQALRAITRSQQQAASKQQQPQKPGGIVRGGVMIEKPRKKKKAHEDAGLVETPVDELVAPEVEVEAGAAVLEPTTNQVEVQVEQSAATEEAGVVEENAIV